MAVQLPARQVFLAAKQLGGVPLQIFERWFVQPVGVLQRVGQAAPRLVRTVQGGV